MRQASAPAAPSTSAFVHALGHELRNVMATVSVSVEVLQTGAGGADGGQRALDILARQRGRLEALMAAGFKLAQLLEGELILSLQPLDLVALMRRVAEDAALPPRLPLQPATLIVDADRACLEQALQLLVALTTDAADHGSVQVAMAQEDGVAVVRLAGEPAAGGGAPALTMLNQLLAEALIGQHGGSVSPLAGVRGFEVRLPLVQMPGA